MYTMKVEHLDVDLVIHTLYLDGKLVHVEEEETEMDMEYIISIYEEM